MATAAERTAIIQLTVGMVNAAPGADILAELEAIIDSGLTMEELAIAISENPAFSGDTGLFPDFLPNAIFAENFMTALLGDEVTAENLEAAVDELTAALNAGDSRGAAMYATIVSLASVDADDADFGDAATALANKVEVAEYYSVDVAQSSADLDDLIAVVSGVTSDDDAVADGTDAVDTEIAANAELPDLVANLDAANEAMADFLDGLDIADFSPLTDVTPATDITASDIEGAGGLLDQAETAVDGLVAGSYAGASDLTKAASIDDQRVAEGLVLTAVGGLNELAADAQEAVDDIDGLGAAIAAYDAAVASQAAADDVSDLAQVALNEALGEYDVANGNALGTTTAGATGTVAGLIIVSGTTLVLDAGITEASDPGITAVLSASLANEGAQLAALAAAGAVGDALDLVENVEAVEGLGGGAAALLAVATDATYGMDALFLLNSGLVNPVAARPTLSEIAIQQALLEAGAEDLKTAIEAVAWDTDTATTQAALQAVLDAAELNGYISAADDTAIFGTFAPATEPDLAAALAVASGLVDTNSSAVGFDVLWNANYLVATGLAALAASTTAPTAAALLLADDNVDTQQDVIDLLEATIAAEASIIALGDTLDDLQADVADATGAFADANLLPPVTLTASLVLATAGDDLYLTNSTESEILSFGVAGDDQLFIGSDLTLNAGDPDDDGDDAVLEYFISGTTNTVITIETSVFGSSAAVPETYTITLTGVASADVSVVDGVVSIA